MLDHHLSVFFGHHQARSVARSAAPTNEVLHPLPKCCTHKRRRPRLVLPRPRRRRTSTRDRCWWARNAGTDSGRQQHCYPGRRWNCSPPAPGRVVFSRLAAGPTTHPAHTRCCSRIPKVHRGGQQVAARGVRVHGSDVKVELEVSVRSIKTQPLARTWRCPGLGLVKQVNFLRTRVRIHVYHKVLAPWPMSTRPWPSTRQFTSDQLDQQRLPHACTRRLQPHSNSAPPRQRGGQVAEPASMLATS